MVVELHARAGDFGHIVAPGDVLRARVPHGVDAHEHSLGLRRNHAVVVSVSRHVSALTITPPSSLVGPPTLRSLRRLRRKDSTMPFDTTLYETLPQTNVAGTLALIRTTITASKGVLSAQT
jgi:hypothetical protein